MPLRTPSAPIGTIEGAAALLPPAPAEVAHVEPLVLVVDDEPEMRQLTETLLGEHGYRVMVAANGHEALHCLRKQCPDLIVLDLNMPVMNGWQFLVEQRDCLDMKCAAVPVLLLTGEDAAATRTAMLHAVGAIQKPFDPDDLLNAVSAAIGSHGGAPDGIRPTGRSTHRTRL